MNIPPINDLKKIINEADTATVEGRIEFALKLNDFYQAIKPYVLEFSRLEKNKGADDEVSFGAEEMVKFGEMFISKFEDKSTPEEFKKLKTTLKKLEEQFNNAKSIEFITVGKSSPGNSTLNICGWLNTDKKVTISKEAKKALRSDVALAKYNQEYNHDKKPTFDGKTAQQIVDEINEDINRLKKSAVNLADGIYKSLETLENKIKSQVLQLKEKHSKGKEYEEVCVLFSEYEKTIQVEKQKFNTKTNTTITEPSAVMDQAKDTFKSLGSTVDKMLTNDNVKYGTANKSFLQNIKTWLQDTFSLFKSEHLKTLETQNQQIHNIGAQLNKISSPKKLK